MKYAEAVKMVEKYQELLIGELINDDEISHLLIVPSNRNHDVEIISKTYWEKSVSDILSRYTDFRVIVVCDLDDPNNHISQYELDYAIAKINKNKQNQH